MLLKRIKRRAQLSRAIAKAQLNLKQCASNLLSRPPWEQQLRLLGYDYLPRQRHAKRRKRYPTKQPASYIRGVNFQHKKTSVRIYASLSK